MSDMGRATRNIVSGYQRDRIFRASLFANESRQLVTDFSGVIPKGRSIVHAIWQSWETITAAMSEQAIVGLTVQVRVSAQYSGRSRIRVDVELDNGDVYSAWHIVRVMGAPYFDNPGWVTGPRRLDAYAGQGQVSDITVVNGVIQLGGIVPIPDGFVVGQPFTLSIAGDEYGFEFSGVADEYLLSSGGTPFVNGTGTLTQGQVWPCTVTWVLS